MGRPPPAPRPGPRATRATSSVIRALAQQLIASGQFHRATGRPPLGMRTVVQEIMRICGCSRDVVHRALSDRPRAAKTHRPRPKRSSVALSVAETVADLTRDRARLPTAAEPSPPPPALAALDDSPPAGVRGLGHIGLVERPAPALSPSPSPALPAPSARETLIESLDYYLSCGDPDPRAHALAQALLERLAGRR